MCIMSFASASFFGKMSMEAMLEHGSEVLSRVWPKGLATCDRSDLVKHDVRQHEVRVHLGNCSWTSGTVRGATEFGCSVAIPPHSVRVAVSKHMHMRLLFSTSPHLLNTVPRSHSCRIFTHRIPVKRLSCRT